MKIQKGDYGYRDKNRKSRLIVTGVLIAAILVQLLARFLTGNQSAKNILTVMAILTVLPMANMASPLIASWKYKTPSREFYDRVKSYENKCTMVYDLVVTTKDHILPFDAVAVHPKGVYAYCSSEKLDAAKREKAEKTVNGLFTANKLDPNLKIICDEHSFFRRLDSLKSADQYEDDGSVEYGAALLRSLSM